MFAQEPGDRQAYETTGGQSIFLLWIESHLDHDATNHGRVRSYVELGLNTQASCLERSCPLRGSAGYFNPFAFGEEYGPHAREKGKA